MKWDTMQKDGVSFFMLFCKAYIREKRVDTSIGVVSSILGKDLTRFV